MLKVKVTLKQATKAQRGSVMNQNPEINIRIVTWQTKELDDRINKGAEFWQARCNTMRKPLLYL
jgi:hypothetical protein